MDPAERQVARARAVASGISGQFEVVGDVRQGDFSFVRVDAAGAALEGPTVLRASGDVRFLDRVGLVAGGDARVYETGRSVVLWADGARVEAEDTVKGSIVVQAAQQPVDVEIELAAGTEAAWAAGGWLRLQRGDHAGALSISGAGLFNTSVSGQISVHLEPWARLGFEAQRPDSGGQEFESEQDARQASMVGGEARIVAAQGAMDAQLLSLSVNLSSVREQGSEVVLEVESSDPRPRVVEVTLDAALFANATDVRMSFDGVPAVRASSVAEVYAGDHAKTTYALTSSNGNHRVVVWVEGFSTHALGFQAENGTAAGQDQEDASSSPGGRDGAAVGGAGNDPEGVDSPVLPLPILLLGIVVAAAILSRRT